MNKLILIIVLFLILPLELAAEDNMNTITLTTVFDNTRLNPNCTPEWGFACVIETPEETILFDTGNDGEILQSNLNALGFAEADFAKIIISHMHWDHVGGLKKMREQHPDAVVFLPASATEEEKEKLICLEAVLINQPQQINRFIYSLGELQGRANEQSLAIPTVDGLVVITGCAHPGIVHIVKAATRHFPDEKIHLVLGGFHLNQNSEQEVREITNELKKLGVEKAAATHCTGPASIKVFAEEFGENYIQGGVGLKLSFNMQKESD